MPEFPDVTVYIEALTERVLNQPIQKIRIGSPFVLRSFEPPLSAAEGKKVLALRWVGKRIVFEIEDDLTFVGGHGATVKRAEIVPALAEEATGAP